MSIETASATDIEIARVLHAALGAYLANNGAAPQGESELLYTPEEAAVRLGLESTNQLYRKTANGTWPCTWVGGRKKFSEANLRDIVKIQGQAPVSKASLRALHAA